MTPEQRCEATARKRYGVITRAEALQLGMPAKAIQRRVARGRWKIVYPAIFFIGLGEPLWEGKLLAACRWGGPLAVASHQAAAELHRLVPRSGSSICITVPRRKNPRDDIELHVDARLPDTKTVKVGCIPATTIERTILDLCGKMTRDVAVRLVESAIRQQRTDIGRLARSLEAFGGRVPWGGSTLRWALERRFCLGVTDSEAENIFIRLMRKSNLKGVHHHVVRKGSRHLAELDFAFLTEKVNVEIDGDHYHRDAVTRERDRQRDAELAQLDWTVLRFTYRQLVQEPEWVVTTIRNVLSLRQNKLHLGH